MPKKKTTPFNSPLVIKLASHTPPAPTQVPGKDWVYWGQKNDYFQFLLDTFYNASKHNAIVNGKTKYIAGGGWGDAGDTIVNSDNETLDDLTYKITLDMEIFGGFAMEVIWNVAGSKAEFRHVDFSAVRTNKDLSKFYYTKNWLTKYGTPNFDPQSAEDWTIYEPFDPSVKGEAQLIYYKCYSPGLDVYPYPEYQAALRYIELEYQIANYWYNRVKNGFMPSAILNFYMGQPTDDEMRKLEERIKAKFTSTDNAGQFILNFAANKDAAADVQQLTPPELGAEYEALNTTLQTEIFTGHGITSGLLFGIKEPGQLGGRTELIEANELFQNRYVTPKQDKLEDFFEAYVFPYIGVKDAELQEVKSIGIDILGNERLFNLLTDDEKRMAIGKDVIVKDKKSIEAERIISNVNSLSPLVANEVMKSLTTNEVRGLVGLKPIKNGDKIPQTNTETDTQNTTDTKNNFSKNSPMSDCVRKLMDEGKDQDEAVATCISKKEKGLLEKLKAKGKKRKITEVIYRRPVTMEMAKNLKQSEMELQMNFKKTKTPIVIGDVRPFNPATIADETPQEIISVVYSYEWIEGFDDSNLATSRDFCVELRTESKAGVTWTREDIDNLDNGTEGENQLSVWEARGGWYNDNGIAVPSCRHQWYQQVIRQVI